MSDSERRWEIQAERHNSRALTHAGFVNTYVANKTFASDISLISVLKHFYLY
jgi:hypothetical protein